MIGAVQPDAVAIGRDDRRVVRVERPDDDRTLRRPAQVVEHRWLVTTGKQEDLVARLQPDLERLRSLIEDSDSEALDYFLGVHPTLLESHDATLVEDLLTALQDYDFEIALDVLCRLEA